VQTFLSFLATLKLDRVNSGHTCSIISFGGRPLALLGLLLAGMASSGILALIVCDWSMEIGITVCTLDWSL